VIDANQEMRGWNELFGFAVQHPQGDGLLCLRAQGAAERGYAQQQQKGKHAMSLSNHDCLSDHL
jgi:hypothetical protein